MATDPVQLDLPPTIDTPTYTDILNRNPSKEPTMIRGVHTMFYSADAVALRTFLRDKLGFPATDVGDGWLIFDLPEADMGCHPAEDTDGARPGTHNISFYCDDIQQTFAELKERGVEFTREITDEGFGLVTSFKMPGGVEVQLYEPRYQKGRTGKG